MKQKIAVFGLGVSGKAAAAFLLQKGHFVLGIDRKAEEIQTQREILALREQGMLLTEESVALEGVEQIIASPGIAPDHPLLQQAEQKKIEVIGEIELAFRHLRNRCIGITGTNGKTTTVLLTTHLLNQGGKKAKALGNVGVGLSSYLLHPDPEEILVIELSSFQLETVQTPCLDMAVVLNLTPNHLDRHPTMEAYALAKLSIQNCLKPGGKFFVSRAVAEEYGSYLRKPFEVWEGLAVNAIAKEWGVAEKDLVAGVQTFQKPPHRIEWVADIRGVSYYNDSKSSNVHSVLYAVNQVDGPIVLIVGGTDKGSSYRPWIEPFRGKVKKLIAYGAAAKKMEEELGRELPFERRGLFRDAVLAACAAAEERDVVLLSPGCSSYDQFKNYEHRGDVFKQIVKERS